MMDSGQKCIVVDIGSGETKAGFAGEDTPLAAFQTTVGRRENEVYKLVQQFKLNNCNLDFVCSFYTATTPNLNLLPIIICCE